MTKHEIFMLEYACVKALIEKRKHILLKVSHLTKFGDGFPKGVLECREGDYDVRRIIVSKLLNWLYERGYSTLTPTTLGQAMEKLTKAMKERGTL